MASHGALTVMVSACPPSLGPSLPTSADKRGAPFPSLGPPLLRELVLHSSRRRRNCARVAVDLNLFNGLSKRAMHVVGSLASS